MVTKNSLIFAPGDLDNNPLGSNPLSLIDATASVGRKMIGAVFEDLVEMITDWFHTG